MKTIISEAVTGVLEAHFTVKAVVADTKECVAEALLKAGEKVAQAKREALECVASNGN